MPEEAADFAQLAVAAGLWPIMVPLNSDAAFGELSGPDAAGGNHPPIPCLGAGLTNRYRPSRLPYLKLLLEDRRCGPEPEAAGIRYADTAVARLAAIVQEDFIGHRDQASQEDWDQALQRANQ